MNLDYIRPRQNEVNQITHPLEYILKGKGKKAVRKIYDDVKYSDFEIEQIKLFRDKCSSEISDYEKNSWNKQSYTDSDLLKILYSSKFEMKKAAENIKQNIEWRQDQQYHTISAEITEVLQKGLIYLGGRDHQLRPIVVLDMDVLQKNFKNLQQQLQGLLNAVCFFCNQIKKNMFVPGKVENWIILIDTKNIGLTSLPTSALGQIIKVLQLNYGGCLHKIGILDPSTGLSFGWSIFKPFLDDEVIQKIGFYSKKNYYKMEEFIKDKQFLEQKYQGYMDDVSQFWPIQKDIFYKENKYISTIQEEYENESIEGLDEIFKRQQEQKFEDNSGSNRNILLQSYNLNNLDAVEEVIVDNIGQKYVFQPKTLSMI